MGKHQKEIRNLTKEKSGTTFQADRILKQRPHDRSVIMCLRNSMETSMAGKEAREEESVLQHRFCSHSSAVRPADQQTTAINKRVVTPSSQEQGAPHATQGKPQCQSGGRRSGMKA